MSTPSRDDRFHDNDRPRDRRTEGQRDRDRVLYASAFRRLGGVTQVAAAGERLVFHNRLTHTLEVAQIARRLAENTVKDQPDEVAALGGIDPDVVEASALAHDLGHPPFGHIAERVLDRLVREYGNSDGFEGNPQSFRIVTKLALSPNPPKDTDGRREDSGRGVRELPGRWPGLHWGRWEVGGRSSVAAQGPYGRLRELRCAGWRENTQQGTLADRGGASLRGRWVSCRLAVRPGVEWLAAGPRRE